jgi:hypothetical protein
MGRRPPPGSTAARQTPPPGVDESVAGHLVVSLAKRRGLRKELPLYPQLGGLAA